MTGLRLTRTQLWYALAFALALLMRLLALGAAPLSDTEAALALQALGISRGSPVSLAGQPGALLISAALFFIFGSSNFLARLWPAVAGSLFVLAPLGFRKQLGPRAALFLAFFLALDPGLVSLSRQVGSPLTAVAFSLFAVAFWLARKPILAGIAFGLALLGGPQFWNGAVIAGVTLGIAILLERSGFFRAETEAPGEATVPASEAVGFSWMTAVLTAFSTVALVGTLFWLAPQGLGAIGASVAAFFQGWVVNSGIPVGRLLAALAGDEILAIGLAVWALWHTAGTRSRVEVFLFVWFLAALALALIPAGRQVGSLAWVLIPLLALAARGAAAIRFGGAEGERTPAWVYTSAVIFMLGFIWLNFTGILAVYPAGDTSLTVRGVALGGGIILLAAATLLVGWGWSGHVARQGLLRGVLLMFAIYTISAATASAGWRLTPPADLWGSYPRPEQARFLGETVGDLSFWKTGNREAIDLTVLGVDSPSLRWYLRGMSAAQTADALSPGAQPSLAITPAQDQSPQLAAAYRGQPFQWDVSPDWSSMKAIDWLTWIAFRTAPKKQGTILLWARSDIFLGANPTPANAGQ
jgi:hypothetical protein